MCATVEEVPVVLHTLPGRVRMTVPGGASIDRCAIETYLDGILGIRRAVYQPATGNALIHYDPKLTDVATLVAAIRSLNPQTPFPTPAPVHRVVGGQGWARRTGAPRVQPYIHPTFQRPRPRRQGGFRIALPRLIATTVTAAGYLEEVPFAQTLLELLLGPTTALLLLQTAALLRVVGSLARALHVSRPQHPAVALD